MGLDFRPYNEPNNVSIGFSPLVIRRSQDTASTGQDKGESIPNAAQTARPAQQMEYVAPPGHGSGCGHCTAQALWVPKEKTQQLRQAMRQQIYNEVLAHEQAHAAAAGHLGGGIRIWQNADGSAGGEVPIKIPSVDPLNPDQTLRDAERIVAAALAPQKPSSQDYSVAGMGRSLASIAQSAKSRLSQQQQQAFGGLPLRNTNLPGIQSQRSEPGLSQHKE